jgi:hypothetical protein
MASDDGVGHSIREVRQLVRETLFGALHPFGLPYVPNATAVADDNVNANNTGTLTLTDNWYGTGWTDISNGSGRGTYRAPCDSAILILTCGMRRSRVSRRHHPAPATGHSP